MTNKKDMEVTLEGDIQAFDYGKFTLPSGAEIKDINGRWGCYVVTFTDPEKYPNVEVQCTQEVEGKFPSYVRVFDDEGEEFYDDSHEY